MVILNLHKSSQQVQYVSGGVARNIAECMSKLGTRPFMISAVGFDMAGDIFSCYICDLCWQ